jgi:O-antigen/teichoic acid export membrane protein
MLGCVDLTDEFIKAVEDSTRGSFFLSVGNFVSTVISAIGVFIIAGFLGPELYGVYNLCFTVPSILLLLVNLGVNEGLTKFSASLHAKGDSNKLASLIRHGIIFNFAVCLFFFLLCFVFSDFLAAYVIARPEYGGYVRVASFVILLQALFNSANAVLVGFYRMDFNALSLIIAAVVKIIVSPLLIILGLSVLGALTGLVVSYLVAAVFGIFVVYVKIYRLLDTKVNSNHFFENTRQLLKYGFPLYAAAIMVGFYSQFQNVILAFFTSDIEIGFFRAAQNFIALIGVISVSISTSVFPAFARLENKRDRLKEFFSLSIKYTSLILLPLILIIIIFSQEIVSFIYGPAYASTAYYLVLVVLQFLFVGIGSIILGSFFSGIGKTRINLQISLVNFVIFLPLGSVFTKSYGVYGLIISNLMASLVSSVYGAFLAKKRFSAEPDWTVTGKIYLASLISMVPTVVLEFFLFSNVLVKLVLGASVLLLLYLTLLPFLGILSLQELASLESHIKKTRPLAFIMKPVFLYELMLLGLLKKPNSS